MTTTPFLEERVREILSRPRAVINGILNPRVVSLEEARVVAQSRALERQSQLNRTQRAISPLEAIANIGQAAARGVLGTEVRPTISPIPRERVRERGGRALELAARPFQAAGALTGPFVGPVAEEAVRRVPFGGLVAGEVGERLGARQRPEEVLGLSQQLLRGEVSPREFAGRLIEIQESKPILQQLISELPAALIPPVGAVQKGVKVVTTIERLAARAVAQARRVTPQVAERVAPTARRLVTEQAGAVGRVPGEAAKEPWQMTRAEYVRSKQAELEGFGAKFTRPMAEGVQEAHGKAIKQAIEQGKPVPDEVLRDYPDLVGVVPGEAAGGVPLRRRPPRSTSQVEFLRELEAREAAGGVPRVTGEVPPTVGQAGLGAPPREPPAGLTAGMAAGQVPLRKGNLLQARTQADLPKDYTVKDALAVHRDLRAQTSSLSNQVEARTRDALRQVGKMDNQGHLVDMPGKPSLYDVAENPGRYTLSLNQKEGLAKLGRLIDDIRNERELFKVEGHLIEVEEGGHFLPRTVLKTKGVELRPRGGGAGLRGKSAERGRRIGVGEVGLAEETGVVYAHPLQSVINYSNRWLQAAADTHVRDLLVPFSETSSMRMPAGLKKRVGGIKKSVQSLRQTAEQLSDKEDIALRAFLESDDPSVDALRDILDNLRVGASATGKKGRNFGKNHAEVVTEINRMRSEIRALAPEWRAAKEVSQPPRPGRQTISTELAPALAGRDFDEKTARVIARYFERGASPRGQVARVLRGVRTFAAAPLRFMQATMDVGTILRQQTTLAATNPRQWATGTFKSFRDAVTAKQYDAFVGGEAGQYAAKRGIAIHGNAAEAIAEFQAPTWMHRVPVIGKAYAAADNFFIRHQTRQRIEWFHLEKHRLEKQYGRALTETEEEQIARAVNRTTGVSSSIPTEIEADLMFAARYTRSTIEEVVKAASSGTLEGQLARRYLLHLVGVATTMVTAAALIQKRPLDEVLNPLDMYSLRRGRVVMNSNFMSVGVFGHDIKPMGAYDSLARILSVVASSAVEAVAERDAYKLFDPIVYVASSKGNPLVSFAVDLMRGRTFTGQDPRSIGAIAQRGLPFTWQSILQGINEGLPWEEVVVGGALEGLGGKVMPFSGTDIHNQFANSLFSGERDYRNLSPLKKRIVDQVIREKRPQGAWRESAFDPAEKRRQARLIELAKKPRTFGVGWDYFTYKKIEAEARGARWQAAQDIEFGDSDINAPDPNVRALARYNALYDDPEVQKPPTLGYEDVDAEIDYTVLEAKRKELISQWEAEEGIPWPSEYILRNSYLRPIPERILLRLKGSEGREIRAAHGARMRYLSKLGPELVDAYKRYFFLEEVPAEPVSQPQGAPQESQQGFNSAIEEFFRQNPQFIATPTGVP